MTQITLRWLVRRHLPSAMRRCRAEEEQALGLRRILPLCPHIALPGRVLLSRGDAGADPALIAARSEGLRAVLLATDAARAAGLKTARIPAHPRKA